MTDSIGSRIRLKMFEKNLSNREVGKQLGVSYQTIANYANDKVVKIDAKIIDGIATILGVDKDWLLRGDELNVANESSIEYADADSKLVRELRAQVDQLHERLIYYKTENKILNRELDKYRDVVLGKFKEQQQREANQRTGS